MRLGIAFSPTIFVSEVGALLAPGLAQHSQSLSDLMQHLRVARKPFITTEGSTSVQHLRNLVELGGREQLVTLGLDHRDSLRRLRNDEAGAFVLDRALLATFLMSTPRLQSSGAKLATWSPAPGKFECYGLMTRGVNFATFGVRVREKIEHMRANRELHALYLKWFQKPLAPDDQIPGLRAGQALGLSMPAQHELLLLDSSARPCNEAVL
jgi:glutamate/aspartate transport system substrate-binding protein